MAEGSNGNGNKQLLIMVVGALAAIAMALIQWSILGGITDLHNQMATVSNDVASLKTGVNDLKDSVADNKRQEQDDVDHLWAVQREPKEPPKP